MTKFTATEANLVQFLNLTENSGMEERLIKRLTEKFSHPRYGVHVSDLTLCVRKAVKQQLEPVPPDIRSVGYFIDGGRRDLIIKDLYGGQDNPSKNIEGIWFSPDIIEEETGVPIEIKTSRSPRSIPEHYKKQLTYYMVLLSRERLQRVMLGRFLIQRIVPKKDDNPFEFWDVEIESEEEFLEIEKELFARRDSMLHALDNKDWLAAIHIKDDKEANWLCRFCPYRAPCYAHTEDE